MVKMSENSINLTRLLMELSPRYFPEDARMNREDRETLDQLTGEPTFVAATSLV